MISAGSRGGVLPYFYTKLRPKGLKKFLGDPPPPPSKLRVWMTRPLPYVKVWIRH